MLHRTAMIILSLVGLIKIMLYKNDSVLYQTISGIWWRY